MGKKTKTGKGRLDKYYHLAKEQGYRARSAFKLIQLNKKYNFLANARCLVDLCAAPGGWLQVASKYMPAPNLIIGIDLAPIKPIPSVISFQQDITTDKCRSQLRDQLKTWKADVFLNDGAPNVGTAWVQDAFTQSELVLHALKLATEFLIKGGTFVTKVFRSKNYNHLLWVFQQLFKTVEATKPPSSRNISAEIFVVCRNFLAPKHIDSKLLDARYVFEEVDLDKEAKLSRKVDIYKPEKQKRQREGYAEGEYLLHRKATILQFLHSNHPIDFLGSFNQLVWEDDEDVGKKLRDWKGTDEEIVQCVADLRVLGKRDFKRLLKWRLSARSLMGIKEEKAKPLVERDDEEGEKDDDDIVNELDNLTKEEQRKARRDKKRLREKKRKLLERMQLNMQTPTDIGLESSANGTLFTAKAIEQSHHQKLDDVSDDDVDDVASSDEYSTDTDDSTDESGMDSDQERIRSIEKSLDHDYTQFKQHQAERTAKGKVREKEDWEEEEFIPAASRKHADSDSDSDDGSDTPMRPETFDESSDDEAIMQSIHDKRKKQGDGQELSKKAKRFFDNPVFAGMDVDDEEEETKQPSAKAAKQPKQQEEDVMSVDEQEEEEAPHRPELDLVTPEGMTLAQALVNKKVSKQSLIDQGFHRRTYHDENGLPSWFTEDEKQHNRPQIPITKEAVQAIRDRLKVIDARPIKKVYEAKARKKQRALDQASKIAKKQADIVDNPDLTEREKAQTVVKIAKRSKSTLADQKKRKIAVVVAKGGNRALKGRPKGVKGRYKMVDKRMKKDIRAMDNAKKKKGKGRK